MPHEQTQHVSLCCPTSWALACSWSNNELSGKGADLNSLKKEFSETWRCTVGVFSNLRLSKQGSKGATVSHNTGFFQCLFVFLWGNFCFHLINANCTPKCFIVISWEETKTGGTGRGYISAEPGNERETCWNEQTQISAVQRQQLLHWQ